MSVAVCKSTCASSTPVASGNISDAIASEPVTAGDAMDVPLMLAYWLPVQADQMASSEPFGPSPPGAARHHCAATPHAFA